MPVERSAPPRSRKVSYSELPPRPPNAWILWRTAQCELMRQGKVAHFDKSKWENMPPDEKQVWFQKADLAKAEHEKKYPDYQYKYYRGTRHKGEEGKREAQERIARAAEAAKGGKGNFTTKSRRKARDSDTDTSEASCSTSRPSLGSPVLSTEDTLVDSRDCWVPATPGPRFGNYDPLDQQAAEARYFRGDPEMVDDDDRFKPGPIGYPYLGRQLMDVTGCPRCDVPGYKFGPHICDNYVPSAVTDVWMEQRYGDEAEYARLEAEFLQAWTRVDNI